MAPHSTILGALSSKMREEEEEIPLGEVGVAMPAIVNTDTWSLLSLTTYRFVCLFSHSFNHSHHILIYLYGRLIQLSVHTWLNRSFIKKKDKEYKI